jgi:hypothetical protein
MINCTYSNGVKPPKVTVTSPPVDNELLGTSGVSARGKPVTTDSDGGATVVGVVVAVEPDCGTVVVVGAVTGLTTVDAGDDAVVVDPFVAVVVKV